MRLSTRTLWVAAAILMLLTTYAPGDLASAWIAETEPDPERAVGWEHRLIEVLLVDAEGMGTEHHTGNWTVRISDAARLTSVRDLVIAGGTSVELPPGQELTIEPPSSWIISGEYYTVDFRYQVLGRGTRAEALLTRFFVLGGPASEDVYARPLLKNAPESGHYSSGVLLPDGDHSYGLSIRTADDASVVVDDVRIRRLEAYEIQSLPEKYACLTSAPYPRLGNYFHGTPEWMARLGSIGGSAFEFSVDEIERRLSWSDVVIGVDIVIQTRDASFADRLRERNPRIVVLPYRPAAEEGSWPVSAGDASCDVRRTFRHGMSTSWIMRTSSGMPVPDYGYPGIRKVNIYESCPVVDGEVFNNFLVNWVVEDVAATGIWDGIYFDNLFDRINPHIPNYSDPGKLSFDMNLNGQRDETPAEVSEMTRKGSIEMLRELRDEVGELELIIGNAGPHPSLALAPYVNGFLLEAWNAEWTYGCADGTACSEAGWRRALDAYLQLGEEAMFPQVVVVQAQGNTGFVSRSRAAEVSDGTTPTTEDIRTNRFALCSALLGDGFYDYDLFNYESVPVWFDEFAVSPNGEATQDPAYKGYLGQPLGDAYEIEVAEELVWEERFERPELPGEMWGTEGVSVDLVAGIGPAASRALVVSNPDHTTQAHTAAGTVPSILFLAPGETYVVEFDWVVLETIDGWISVGVRGEGSWPADYYVPGVVEGDSGRSRFPLTMQNGSAYSLGFMLGGGGGSVAFDNIRVSRGGAGPWRRDFENGFVLVNPLSKPVSFQRDLLAGPLQRVGIRRIQGTQDPLANSGEPAGDSLMLGPFDALILLAAAVPNPNPSEQICVDIDWSSDTADRSKENAGGQTALADWANGPWVLGFPRDGARVADAWRGDQKIGIDEAEHWGLPGSEVRGVQVSEAADGCFVRIETWEPTIRGEYTYELHCWQYPEFLLVGLDPMSGNVWMGSHVDGNDIDMRDDIKVVSVDDQSMTVFINDANLPSGSTTRSALLEFEVFLICVYDQGGVREAFELGL